MLMLGFNDMSLKGLAPCNCQVQSVLFAAVSKGDLLQVLVAEDLYDRLGEAAELLKRATYKAARRWAGQEEVCRARMMSFLYDACPSARFFMQVAPIHAAPLLGHGEP